MSENIKNVPVEEIEETEVVEEVTEVKEKKENILKKGMGWIKSHGKTVAKGAAVAALGVIAYGLGKVPGQQIVYLICYHLISSLFGVASMPSPF